MLITEENLFIVDSGGQYLEGTTEVARTSMIVHFFIVILYSETKYT